MYSLRCASTSWATKVVSLIDAQVASVSDPWSFLFGGYLRYLIPGCILWVVYSLRLATPVGPGSLLSLLKANGWAAGLNTGLHSYRHFNTYDITVRLMPEGLLQLDAVVRTCFQVGVIGDCLQLFLFLYIRPPRGSVL